MPKKPKDEKPKIKIQKTAGLPVQGDIKILPRPNEKGDTNIEKNKKSSANQENDVAKVMLQELKTLDNIQPSQPAYMDQQERCLLEKESEHCLPEEERDYTKYLDREFLKAYEVVECRSGAKSLIGLNVIVMLMISYFL